MTLSLVRMARATFSLQRGTDEMRACPYTIILHALYSLTGTLQTS